MVNSDTHGTAQSFPFIFGQFPCRCVSWKGVSSLNFNILDNKVTHEWWQNYPHEWRGAKGQKQKGHTFRENYNIPSGHDDDSLKDDNGLACKYFLPRFFIFISEITTEKGLLLCVLMRCGVALRKTFFGTKYITSL